MLLKAIPIGKDNFKEIIENNNYYVDKSKVIEDLIVSYAKILLYTRPRRFGKSLFISMLDNFFNIDRKEVDVFGETSYYKIPNKEVMEDFIRIVKSVW